MTFTLVQRPEQLSLVEETLRGVSTFSLDCEAAGFHRYRDRLCLLQMTTHDRTVLVDTLAVDPSEVLRGPLGDPEVEVTMHGADYDIRLLHRDLGLELEGLFDTQIAAALLGEPGLGLQALLEKFVGLTLEKKYQRADWARRPLPEGMLAYAAEDTKHLAKLRGHLVELLKQKDRGAWAKEEFQRLEKVRSEERNGVDPVTRVKGARDLTPRQVSHLRAALEWREGIAEETDSAPFRVSHDSVLLGIAENPPTTVSELSSVKGLSPRLIARKGEALLKRLRQVSAQPEEGLIPYPRNSGGPGRPPPEVEQMTSELRKIREGVAEELGIDKGVLISNALLTEIATKSPRGLDALGEIPEIRRWQVNLLGEAFLDRLKQKA